MPCALLPKTLAQILPETVSSWQFVVMKTEKHYCKNPGVLSQQSSSSSSTQLALYKYILPSSGKPPGNDCTMQREGPK